MAELEFNVPKEAIDELFSQWDPDNSGSLELKELVKILKRGDMTEEEWKALDTAMMESMLAFPAETEGKGNPILEPTEVLDDGTKVFDLTAEHTRLVTQARSAGAAAKFCGSGGAIVAVARSQTNLDPVVDALEAAGSVCRRVGVAVPS